MADDAFLLGQIVARLDAIDSRLTKIDERLDDGDKRFKEADKQGAADDALRNVAVRVGSWVLGIAGVVGAAVLAHIPWVAEWLLPPKH